MAGLYRLRGPRPRLLIDLRPTLGKVAQNWNQDEFDGFVTNSVVVLLTRNGNPKNIRSWDDLLKDGNEERYFYTEREWDKYRKDVDGSKKLDPQRFKGLGEMDASQLWDTTMDPDRRTLLQVTLEDAVEADRLFTILMGEDVPARKDWIETNAKDVQNLDV